MSGAKILCAENHPEYMSALQYMLELAGHEVIPATSGEQALRLMRAQVVHGVLLEFDLQHACGQRVEAEMKRIKPEVPVLLFNGVAGQGPSLLRFCDSVLRNSERLEEAFAELES